MVPILSQQPPQLPRHLRQLLMEVSFPPSSSHEIGESSGSGNGELEPKIEISEETAANTTPPPSDYGTYGSYGKYGKRDAEAEPVLVEA